MKKVGVQERASGCAMKMRFAAVPVQYGETAEAELNQFVVSHRIVSVERQFVADGARSLWAVCVVYVDGGVHGEDVPSKGKVDYRERMNPEDFAVFAKLRALRKELAEKEGVPPYAIFTNEHLEAMVVRRIRNVAELSALEGVGPGRTGKYADAFLAMMVHMSSVLDRSRAMRAS
jgi:superfamily II DNA helicase RecQ